VAERSSANVAYSRATLDHRVRCKGSLISGRLGYVEDHFATRWREYLEALSGSTRQIIETGILKSSWYPFEAFLDVSGTAERLFGDGDYQVVRAMAARSARVNMPTLYKIFLRLGSPEFMMKKVASLWQVHYDSGVATSIAGDHRGRVDVVDFGRPDPLHCNGITGFMEECLRLVSITRFEIIHTKCRCRGDDVCRWDSTWE
jgi:hypothetical protein